MRTSTLTYNDVSSDEHDRLSDKPFENIVLIVAMQTEANPIIQALQFREYQNLSFTPELGLRTYRADVHGKVVTLVINGRNNQYDVDGVGTNPAILTSYEVCRTLKPDLILSAGTAGGISEKGASIGDVYLSTKQFVYHDRRIALGNFELYGVGHIRCLKAQRMAKELGLKTGIISTGNSLQLSLADEQQLFQNGATLKEMEIAAIAEVAARFNIPVLGIKSVTNQIGMQTNTALEFERNFQLAVTQLAEKIQVILPYLLGKTARQIA